MDAAWLLNSAQREAVSTHRGPLLVLAGAGTGKTRVITYRMVSMIQKGVDPQRILSVTFTNKAAREMKERTLKLIPKTRRNQVKPVISTFHSLCVQILRKEIQALNYPQNFAIYDRSDQESAARSALREIRVQDKSLKPADLINRISRWKMAAITPENARDFVENDLDFLAAVAYRRYQANLQSSGAVDFDDLLLLTNRLFQERTDVLVRYQQTFDFVQIDEYQDTNQIQFKLVEFLVESHHNLCVVGDDDQSIYGWRGAEVEHILNFQHQFPTAKVVRLEENYRSTDKILDLANTLVRHNKGRHDKKLIPQKKSTNQVQFFEYPDETIEAEQTIRKIEQLIQYEKVPAQDIAVLFRTNEQPRIFESEFRRVGIPYLLIGSQSFFDRREIRDILAYLKVIQNPHDEISLLRIINTPTRGIGNTTVQKILAHAVQHRIRFWDALEDFKTKLSAKMVSSLTEFRNLLNRFKGEFDQHPQRMSDTLRSLLEAIDYESEIQKQYSEASQQLARTSVLEQLVDSMQEYVDRSSEPNLVNFLSESALNGKEDHSDQDKKMSQAAVKLMTLHSAKGLEFPYVFLVGLEEGLLPHRRSIEGPDSMISEERRLLYVGITRAQDQLFISRAAARKKWGKLRPSIPSRFLFEMRPKQSVTKS